MKKSSSQPEAWLRGPIRGVPTPLQPVAHALVQALEDAERIAADLDPTAIWTNPGGAAAIGFHLQHMSGSLDRLFTYARGETLSDEQFAQLAAEGNNSPAVTAAELLRALRTTVEQALDQLRSTPVDTLDDPRSVGRAGLPSTVRGLLHHAGEHAARHAGQISTTARVLHVLQSGRST